nr:hypothetical protein [Tanacetum cinerariifolium]
TDPHVLADQTKSVSEGLDTVLTQPLIGKRDNSIARQVKEEKASSIIKLEDLAKLLGAQPGYKKQSSLTQTFVSNKEATKGGSSKAPTGSKIGHSKKRRESSSAMDSIPSQPLVSTPVDPGMHKEDQQAIGDPNSL